MLSSIGCAEVAVLLFRRDSFQLPHQIFASISGELVHCQCVLHGAYLGIRGSRGSVGRGLPDFRGLRVGHDPVVRQIRFNLLEKQAVVLHSIDLFVVAFRSVSVQHLLHEGARPMRKFERLHGVGQSVLLRWCHSRPVTCVLPQLLRLCQGHLSVHREHLRILKQEAVVPPPADVHVVARMRPDRQKHDDVVGRLLAEWILSERVLQRVALDFGNADAVLRLLEKFLGLGIPDTAVVGEILDEFQKPAVVLTTIDDPVIRLLLRRGLLTLQRRGAWCGASILLGHWINSCARAHVFRMYEQKQNGCVTYYRWTKTTCRVVGKY
mmetsp:Transcript_614/g.1289  ORF Transcript_614/g.1289 Transcript_614/m.1289 type:complete len:323 (+) Transcript_614:203-1171(+)